MSLFKHAGARGGFAEAMRAAPAPGTSLGRPLRIGLVNNMPDAALGAAEAQVRSLLDAVAGPDGVRLQLYALESAPRGAAALRRLARTYGDLKALMTADLDAIVVTGAEPQADAVVDEPVYEELAMLAVHAERATTSSLWSCLAAHAAVHHLLGVPRRSLQSKLSGVFPFARGDVHPLGRGLEPVLVPHSRLNGLDEGELRAAGCTILTSSPAHGVDAFALERRSLFVFLQGHPEYAGDALLHEWRRDIRRAAAAGVRPPPPPLGYFSPEAEASLAAAARDGPAALLTAALDAPLRGSTWRPFAERFWRNWLDLLSASTLKAAEARPS